MFILGAVIFTWATVALALAYLNHKFWQHCPDTSDETKFPKTQGE